MWDSESYFLENGTFPEPVNEETRTKRLVAEIVDGIWETYDKDKSGGLDRDETRRFLQETLGKMDDGTAYKEEEFEETFNQFDLNHNGLIEKAEMAMFIQTIIRA